MKIIQKIEYKPDRYGMYDYPIGYIFKVDGNKYTANISKESCDACDLQRNKYCDLVYCSSIRKDNNNVIFKMI